MVNELRGKSLLLLGSSTLSVDIVDYAKAQGVYTIVTDYLDSSPAKEIADESLNISTADVNTLVDLVNTRNIDAVFAGVSEFNIEKALMVCDQTGLPFYANKKQWDIATNKDKFKRVCREHGVPVVEEFSINNSFKQEDLSKIKYPVIIKPVDSSSSRGIYICKDEKDLKINYEKSLAFSKSKTILIERYMTCEEVVIYYTIQDGFISLSAMCDRYTNKEQLGVAQLPTAYIFPSKYLDSYQNTVDEDVRKMFEAIGIKNGVAFIQSFVEDGKVYFYEMGYRLNGAQEFRIVSKVNEINSFQMMVNFALTGKMNGWDVKHQDNPKFNKWCCKLTPLAKPGIINRISGIDEITAMPEVVDVAPVKKDGDTIAKEDIGTLKQIVTRIYIIAEDKETLIAAIDKIQSIIKVTSVDGDDMLMTGFDTKLL